MQVLQKGAQDSRLEEIGSVSTVTVLDRSKGVIDPFPHLRFSILEMFYQLFVCLFVFQDS